MKKVQMKNNNYKFDVITVGGATQDITYYSDDALVLKNPNKKDVTRQRLLCFEYGAKINMDKIDSGFGGGACNSAVSFSRLGLKTASILRVGNSTAGAQIKQMLNQVGVNTKFIQQDKEKQSGFSFIIASAHEKGHTIFVYRGANTNLQIKPQTLQKLKPKFYYVTSWSQKPWQKDFNALLKYKGNSKISWNPGGKQLATKKSGLVKYLRHVDVFNVNKDEAIELVVSCNKRKDKKFLNNPRNLLRAMQDWGPEIVIVTDGARGAYAIYQDKIYYEKALGKKKVDTTGAGDSFGSGFVSGLLLFDYNIKKALRLGIVNSGHVVQEVGAQKGILTFQQAKKYL